MGRPRRRALENRLAWSKSRDAVFLECPRQYWFQYYGFWEGWEVDAPPRTRRIYILKQLKSRHVWAGERVHASIERSLKNLAASSRPLAVDVDEIVEITLDEMRLDYRSSKAGQYRQRPKTCALFEHEYGLEVPDEEWKRIAASVERCLRNFYVSETFRRIADSVRSDWLECKDFSSFDLDGVKVYVVLDFAMREGGEVAIYDWKTGSSAGRDNRVQMACYAYYAHQRWQAEPGGIRTVEYNLNRNELLVRTPSAAELDWTRAYIEGSIADMRRLLRDSARNIAVEDDFRKVNDEQSCSRCAYLAVCEPPVLRARASDSVPAGPAA
jgi:CRISPR/Cas system-associated exonuclease Cas4 (RecB family)